jgi:hypothetical protein
MRTVPLFAFVLAGAACQSAPTVRDEAAPPTLPLQDFQVVSQSLTDCAVKFSGTVEAATEAFTVEKAVFEFVVDGAVLKQGELPLNLKVEPGGKADFTIDERFTYVKDEAELRALDARGGSLLVALRGQVVLRVAVPGEGQTPASTRTLELPFARAKDVRTPRLPHLKLVEWEGGRFSETEVQVVYHLGVVNPNPFAVSMQGLDYAITLAGKEVAKGTIGAGEKVSPASTGVFDVTAMLNEGTHGPEVKKLIKGLVLPYTLGGTLRAALYTEALAAKGEVKLTPPR